LNSSDLRPARLAATAALAAAVAAFAAVPAVAATAIVINNVNAPGVGFNDTTPVAPVGGNTGTTLGEQRRIAFVHAATIWGANLTSSVPIVINAQFSALSCTSTSAVLGSAGATRVFRDFAGATRAGTWYSYALANKLFGAEISDMPAPQINANFNVNLGAANCLAGSPFYLGLDNNAGTAVNFVTTLLHEMGHGLGFQTFTSGTTGAFLSGFPSIWDHFLTDDTLNRTWVSMTATERAASAIRPRSLSWAGATATNAAPGVLTTGTPTLQISGPAAGPVTGTLLIGTASFGAPIRAQPVTGQVMPVVDQPNGTGLACTALSPANATAVRNNIALVDRGVCGFTVKAKAVQDAGAIGVIVVDNVAGSPPPDLGGADPSVVIPAVRISLADGDALKAQLKRRSRTVSGVVGSLYVAGSQLAGANTFGRVWMFTPNPFQSGSSVSHWDTSATRNLLMEPSINADLTQSVKPPEDLTLPLLQDTGW
jgi:hypothetical protein